MSSRPPRPCDSSAPSAVRTATAGPVSPAPQSGLPARIFPAPGRSQTCPGVIITPPSAPALTAGLNGTDTSTVPYVHGRTNAVRSGLS
eukprot:SAG22_NODE_201_length_15391_cov_7.662176_10_plen_88_part_00